MTTKIEQSTSSNNKQFLHIITECMVGVGIVFWFSSKCKRMSSELEELFVRLENQEEQIQHLQKTLNNLIIENNRQETPRAKTERQKIVKQSPTVNQIKTQKQESPAVNQIKIEPKILQFTNKIETIEEENSETESEMDNEISNELNELYIESNLKNKE